MNNYDNLLFNIQIDSGAPGPGSVLVAEPFLRDQHFLHSVILLVDYEHAAPSMGVVLNRLSTYSLQGLISGSHAPNPFLCSAEAQCHTTGFSFSTPSVPQSPVHAKYPPVYS